MKGYNPMRKLLNKKPDHLVNKCPFYLVFGFYYDNVEKYKISKK